MLNAETGALEDTVVSATKVVTDCYKRIVEGQEQTVERTTTYTNGIVTDVNEKVTDLNTSIKYTEGALGGFSKFVLDLDTKLGGLEKVASNLTKALWGSGSAIWRRATAQVTVFGRTSTSRERLSVA